MWQVLISAEPDQRAPMLQQRLRAPIKQLEADLAAFAQDCIERGFLRFESPQAPQRAIPVAPRRGFLPLRAWWSLASTVHMLSNRGFADTYHHCSCLCKPATPEARFTDLIQRAEEGFLLAEHLFVMRSAPQDCLPRSLALYRFLLSVGIPANHCIGIKQYPFHAHAWVESANGVVCDSADFVCRFTELARL